MAEIPDPWESKDVDLDLFVSYRDLSMSYLLPTTEYTGFAAPFRNLADTVRYNIFNQKDLKSQFYRINSLSGYLKPGESTLILSPPGAGASTLLKALTLSLPMDSGDLLFNAMTNEEASSTGADLKRALRYVGQQDTHFETMTVWESIKFAHRLTSVEPSNAYLDHLLSVFSMEECRNTPTGQISGGQRRRLSTMIGLSNPAARVFALDCYSDGLDSAAVQRITDYLVAFAKTNNAHFICALQQPSPLVFEAFDRLIVLKDGTTVYNGPIVDSEAYFSAMGFPCPGDIDLPSHIMHATTNPKLCLVETHLQKVKVTKKNKAIKSSSLKSPVPKEVIATSLGPVDKAKGPIVTPEEMNEFFLVSPFSQQIETVLDRVEALREKNDLPPTANMAKRATQGLSQTNSTHDPNHTNNNTSNDPTPQITHKTSVHPNTVSTEAPLVDFTPQVLTPNTLPYFSKGYATSIYTLLVLVLSRQLLLNWRDRGLMVARLIPAIIISFFLSGLYFRTGSDQYTQRFAGLDGILVEYGYNNMVEISLSIAARPLIANQLDLYPTWIYATSVQIASIPFSLLETFVFVVISYSMMGHSSDTLTIFTHFFILWIHGLFLGAVFRFGASIAANTSQAYAIISPAVSIFAFCGGFLIKPSDLKWPMRALFWISPFGSAFRALSINEMTSPRYNYLIPSPSDPAILERAGDVYLRISKLPTSQAWLVGSTVYSLGMIILLVSASAYFLYRPYAEYTIGTRRFVEETDVEEFMNTYQSVQEVKDKDEMELRRFQIEKQKEADLEFTNSMLVTEEGADSPVQNDDDDIEMVSTHRGSVNEPSRQTTVISSVKSQLTSRSISRSRFASGNAKLHTLTNDLPFTPVTLAFKDIRFTVKAADDHGKLYNRVLLQDISAYAMPGTTTALMGSSGAGKSTLLNTLIGLNKTTGTQTVEGEIFVNGQLLNPSQFSSICGYCEQFETLYPYDTVFETLMFSARMRLETRDTDILTRVVNEVISILELDQVRDHMIGNSENPVLSQSQKKLVSIGIELTGNPSILFLDEPTTGLSSEAAITVCRAISQVARSGRAVICTIHQPSSQIFLEFFDNLLLLGSGGYTLYFGRLGNRASNLIEYYHQVDGFAKFPQRTNPAEHLVEAVSMPLADNLVETAENMYNAFYNDDDDDDDDDEPEREPNQLTHRGTGTTSSPPTTTSQPKIRFHRSARPISNRSGKIPTWSSLSSKQRNVFYLYLKYQSSQLRQHTADFLNLVISDKRDAGVPQNLLVENEQPQHDTLVTFIDPKNGSAPTSPRDSDLSSNQLLPSHGTSSPNPFGLGLDTSPADIGGTIHEDEVSRCQDTRHQVPSSTQTILTDLDNEDSGDGKLQFVSSPIPEEPKVVVQRTDPRPGFRGQQGNLTGTVAYSAPTDFQGKQQDEFHPPVKSPLWYQVCYVVNRQWHLYIRNTEFFWTRMVSAIVTNLFYGLLYVNMKIRDQGSLIAFFASTVFSTGLIAYLMGTTALPLYNYLTRTVFYREQHYHYYNPTIWTFAWFVCEAVWIFPIAVVSIIPIYYMTGATNSDFPSLAATIWAGYINCLVISNFGLMLALSLPTAITEIVMNVAISIMFAAQGISISRRDANALFKVIMMFDPFYYLNRAITVVQFRSREGMILIYRNGASVLIPIKDWVGEYTGFSYSGYWWSFLWLTMFIATFYSIATLSAVFLRWKT